MTRPAAIIHPRRSYTSVPEAVSVCGQDPEADLEVNLDPAGAGFGGFPERTLLEAGAIPISDLAQLACKEGQSTSPIYRVHRWFARRLGTQFRGMLAGLVLADSQGDGFWDLFEGEIPLWDVVVLDPFVGGGTSVVEASRCGARVIGYDIDPVAASITRFELSAAASTEFPAEIRQAITGVRQAMRPLHETEIAGRRVEVLHHFWVELSTCAQCNHTFEAHPRYELAHDAGKKVRWAFCRGCHAVQEVPLAQCAIDCTCGTRTEIAQGSLERGGKIRCPVCLAREDLSARGRRSGAPPEWRLFAQEYVEGTGRALVRRFKPASAEDRQRVQVACEQLAELEATGTFAPNRAIPVEGRLDGRPLIYGFTEYRQLFNPRQLLHLTRLGSLIRDLPGSDAKRVLMLAFSDHLTTNCMYTGYAFGYRRTSPLFSIHGYRHISRPVELNPWLEGTGRGTFPNALRKVERAMAFARRPYTLSRNGKRITSGGAVGGGAGPAVADPAQVLDGTARSAIRTQSSADLQELPTASVDLILTDPPYLDNVNYSELSDFYLAWHQSLGVADPPYDEPGRSAPLRENLAVSDRSGTAIETYRSELSAIFQECRRVLRPNGVCVFTYHHVSPKAWIALAHALYGSGLRCTAVLPMRGEGQGGLHTKEGTIKWDAVLVCRPGTIPDPVDPADLVVSHATLDDARRYASRYVAELKEVEAIGFNEPDVVNYICAFLASRAERAQPHADQIPLEAALALAPREGQDAFAPAPPQVHAVPDQEVPVPVHPHGM